MYSFYIFNIIVLLCVCVCVCVYMIVCRLNLLVVKLKSKKIFEKKNKEHCIVSLLTKKSVYFCV